MMLDTALVAKVMRAVLSQTRVLLAADAIARVREVSACDNDTTALSLYGLTATAALGGELGVRVAFSFEPTLLDALFAPGTAGFAVPKDEEDLYRREAAAEMLNIVLGLSTADLPGTHLPVPLSPPVLLEEDRHVPRPSDARFASAEIRTDKGCLGISLAGPETLFDSRFNWLGREEQ